MKGKGKSRKAKYLRFHKGLNQARRLMAAVLGTSMITTNIGSTTVWAAVPETKTENTNFVFDQTELGNALIDAANGNSVAKEFNFVGEAAEDYAGLFELEDEKLYELKGLEQNKGDLTVKVYARLSSDGFVMDDEDESEGEDDEYMITGDEQIIFLLLNSSAKQTGTIEVAGNTSQKIEILSAKELKKQMKIEEEVPAPDTANTTDTSETTTPDGETTDTSETTTPDGETTDTPDTTTPDGETTDTTDTKTPDGETTDTADKKHLTAKRQTQQIQKHLTAKQQTQQIQKHLTVKLEQKALRPKMQVLYLKIQETPVKKPTVQARKQTAQVKMQANRQKQKFPALLISRCS